MKDGDERMELEVQEQVDMIVGSACVDPGLSELAAIVVILEKVTEAVQRLKNASRRTEHVAAHGHLQTALDYERRILAEYTARNRTMGAAVRLDANAVERDLAVRQLHERRTR